MYDTWYLSVSPDILNIPDIPDIPYIPGGSSSTIDQVIAIY